MNILLTNDDGIESEGIQILARALRARGKDRICVLAPESNRSGISHGLTMLFNPLKLKEQGPDTWSCSGMPVDCVIAGLMGALPCKPDAVVSGINRGANIGTDIIYSGTAAAARQAALMGFPAIALSLNGHRDFNWDMAAQYAADHLEDFIKIWERDIFINVNIPNSPEGPEGMLFTWPARKDYHDVVTVMNGPGNKNWYYLAPGQETVADEKGSDWEAVARNFVSVSPIGIHPVVRRDLCPGAPDYAATGKRGG